MRIRRSCASSRIVGFLKAPTEKEIQSAFFMWIKARSGSDWRFKLIFAVPNGAHLARGAIGYRSLAAQGVRPGVSDVVGLIPNDEYHGFVIEFKSETGKVSDEQEGFMALCSKAKIKPVVCRSVEDGIQFVTEYLQTAID